MRLHVCHPLPASRRCETHRPWLAAAVIFFFHQLISLLCECLRLEGDRPVGDNNNDHKLYYRSSKYSANLEGTNFRAISGTCRKVGAADSSSSHDTSGQDLSCDTRSNPSMIRVSSVNFLHVRDIIEATQDRNIPRPSKHTVTPSQQHPHNLSNHTTIAARQLPANPVQSKTQPCFSTCPNATP